MSLIGTAVLPVLVDLVDERLQPALRAFTVRVQECDDFPVGPTRACNENERIGNFDSFSVRLLGHEGNYFYVCVGTGHATPLFSA